MKRFVHEPTTVDLLNAFEGRLDELKSSEEVEASEDFGDEFQYEFVKTKQVQDSDGFYTDYTMYYDVLNDRYVMVFGDRDIYRPEDEDFDWECETEAEATEWFENYKGFADELEGDEYDQ